MCLISKLFMPSSPRSTLFPYTTLFRSCFEMFSNLDQLALRSLYKFGGYHTHLNISYCVSRKSSLDIDAKNRHIDQHSYLVQKWIILTGICRMCRNIMMDEKCVVYLMSRGRYIHKPDKHKFIYVWHARN